MAGKHVPIPKAPRLKPLKSKGVRVPDFLHGAAKAERGGVVSRHIPKPRLGK